LERLWNLAAGFTREDDTLPVRLLTEPLPDGPAAGHVVGLSPMIEEYYRARGWDATGVPSRRKLDQLGVPALLGEGVMGAFSEPSPGSLSRAAEPAGGPGQGWRPSAGSGGGAAVLPDRDPHAAPSDPGSPGPEPGSDGPPDSPRATGKGERHLRSV